MQGKGWCCYMTVYICCRLLVTTSLPFCSGIAVDCPVHILTCCRTVYMLPTVRVPAVYISKRFIMNILGSFSAL